MSGDLKALRDQLERLHERVDVLSAQSDAANYFAIGICAALNDVLQVASEHCPQLIRDLEPRYREGRLLYKQADRGADVGTAPESYQPMSMLYALLDSQGAFRRAGL
ncbi:MAG: hypothetical protein CL543_09130 [Alcanivorax sp.]|nr:hypothetical protein [Alcanivorax sp.]MAY12013.1 hypothetical protein [Alcanivorax sp.]MBI55615.1 hypothetical protein [Alcanivorax sp.]MBU59030.1 hypothetical protein [Alcanivorax sp.]|tara:strand:+ start:568 stop:888 length:321 start_codon:yes stop_codon:yes gene_type:complete